MFSNRDRLVLTIGYTATCIGGTIAYQRLEFETAGRQGAWFQPEVHELRADAGCGVKTSIRARQPQTFACHKHPGANATSGRRDKYALPKQWMQSMETEEWIDDEGVAAQRARARNLLPQITQQVKQALQEASIDIDVFLMIPAMGDAVATFGTLADPPDELWTRIGEIVCAVLGNTVGLERARSRELACATTADISAELTSSAVLHATTIALPTSMPPINTGEPR